MKPLWGALLILLLSVSCAAPAASPPAPLLSSLDIIKLPEPRLQSDFSLEQALSQRRSVRTFAPAPLTLPEVSQLLWAAQGLNSGSGGRTAPSAGATYPLEVYLAVGSVNGLAPGLYRYQPEQHSLARLSREDVRANLSEAALRQDWVAEAAADIVITAAYGRTTARYGERGIRYSYLEAGHAAQNIYLQAEALGLGTVAVGAFDDSRVAAVLGLPGDETPLYILPVGRNDR